ncbi:polysaccharide biosynthesis protein [Limobrevibacterium gyesilva]|uniref:Polysaccharide biosynthesis protein n=1 Tax=Limobrevibacterium gyesilva TaxID=2991712 RepID=A0AA42CFK3_9PROT|nr:nucleoside-diphosphate sugar epimerase/dehydratase [Limobrevibacterium gyesilva]MCW3477258.1 polysaccharide biosynthesis protein [Limobrevibacterium gyesilva]
MATRRALTRIAVNAGLDGLLAAAAVPLAQWLANPAGDPLTPLWAIPWGAVALLLAGIPFRLSEQYWRFAGVGDLLGVAAASIATAALFPVVLHEAGVLPATPAFPAVHALVLMVLLAVPRIAYRLMQENPTRNGEGGQDVLLVGAGEGADLFIRALSADREAPWHVAGLLSLGQAQTGRRIHGYPILGPVDEAPAVLARMRAEDRLPSLLVVTESDLAGPALAALMEAADREGLRVFRAPRPTALDPAATSSRVELKPVAIEDLLNRPQVALDRAGMARLIQGRRVLVTGAGGSIGSELARQVATLGPELLVLLDNGEFALWQIDLELAESAPEVPRRALIADIRDEPRIRAVMAEVRPELVFHAAALKHVPVVESNPLEGLLTNAAGTRAVADAARDAGAQAMVVISTDKAVNPTSVMGASKRLAEMYCQALDIATRGPAGGMRCITVRFGNVLGSTGSVVPLFQRQLARGGPLTVTHPDMQRYFMTVREAVGLVLQASVVGTDPSDTRRDGGIFVLDMGAPVKIVDLARQMIRLAGLRPDVDVQIRFTGLRPGEKLFEELFHGKEPPTPTGHPGLLMATPRTADPAIVGRAIDEIASSCRGGQVRLALNQLGRMVPEFEHNVDGNAGSAHA